MIRKILFYLILISYSGFLGAQSITGKVIDFETGLALQGVNILIQGETLGTTTNENGQFTMALKENIPVVLLLSYIGYETFILTADPKSQKDLGLIKLKSKLQSIGSTVVVTAQRDARDAFRVPEAITVLKAKQILQNGSRSTAEALIGTAGVWMQKTNHGGGSPFVRGLTGNQTLLLLDGIRLNNSTYRYGPNQYFNTIDVLNIDQVEVLRGAGSVLYGTDALGGTIQVFSNSPNFSNQGWNWNGRVFGRYLNEEMEKTGRVVVGLSGEKAAFQGGFSYRDFGDLVAGEGLGTQAPSAYGEIAGDFKSIFQLSSNAHLTVAYNGVFQSEVGRYDQVAQRGYQMYQFNPQNRQLAYARLKLQTPNKWFDQINLTSSIQNSLEVREKLKEGSNIKDEEEDEVTTLGLVAEVISKPTSNWKIVSGIDFYQDWVGSTASEINLEQNITEVVRGLYPDDSKAGNLAIFTSHTLEFGKLIVNAGTRFNYFNLQIQDDLFGDTEITPTALVGNVSLNYLLAPKHVLSFSLNSGFRAPNINDLSSFGSFDFGIEVPSSNLSSERTLTYELGYKFRKGKSFSNVALYYTQLFDLIGRVRGTFNGQATFEGEDVYQKANVDEAFITGFEWDNRIQLASHWDLMASLIYTYGQTGRFSLFDFEVDKENSGPLRRIPPLNGRMALSYRPGKIFGQLEWWYAGGQPRLSGGDISDHRIADGGTAGWGVLNLKAAYQVSNFQIHLGLNNLLNQAYRIHGSGVDGVGRSAWFSLQFDF